MRAEPSGDARRLPGGDVSPRAPGRFWKVCARRVLWDGARRFLGRGGSLFACGGSVRAEPLGGARRLRGRDRSARAPRPPLLRGSLAAAVTSGGARLPRRTALAWQRGRAAFGCLSRAGRFVVWRVCARRVLLDGARRLRGWLRLLGGCLRVCGGPVRAELSGGARRLCCRALPPGVGWAVGWLWQGLFGCAVPQARRPWACFPPLSSPPHRPSPSPPPHPGAGWLGCWWASSWLRLLCSAPSLTPFPCGASRSFTPF